MPSRFIELLEAPRPVAEVPVSLGCRVVVGALELRFDAPPDVQYVAALARACERGER